MKHVAGLISTTQALRQIFLPSLDTCRLQFFRYTAIHPLSKFRLLHSTGFRAAPNPQKTPPKTTQIRDEDIRAEFVQIVNDNGNLDPPISLRNALGSFDRAENFLLQVSPGFRDRPPVCKIVNRVTMRQQERVKAKAAHAAKTSIKQIELNWAIDAHDLAHRLKQLTTFLDKGRRVEIIMTRKKGKRAPTVEEVKNLMDSVMEVTREANAMQVKPMEGVPGKHVILVVKKRD